MLSRVCGRLLCGHSWKIGLQERNYHVLSIGANSSHNTLYNYDQTRESLKKKSICQHPLFSRNLSTSITAFQIAKVPETPAIPTIPDAPAAPIEETIISGAEPSFESLGLGGWSPIGMLQKCLEFLHVTCDLPWWASIVIVTVVVRMLLTPLVIIAQRNAAVMQKVMPEMQVLQTKITEARQMGNAMETARHSQDLMLLMRTNNFNPLKNMLVPLAQAPIFMSFFFGLRRMINVPVDSLHTGGLFWFTDLTLADPYYILPILTSATLYLTIHFGTDGNMVTGNQQIAYYALRTVPVVMFPFIMYFPAGMVVYWATSNTISLVQGALFRRPKVRIFFNIPELVQHDASKLPPKKKFTEGVKDTWSNMKLAKQLEERARLDANNFQRAGENIMVKTFKHDPTKSRAPEILTKKS